MKESQSVTNSLLIEVDILSNRLKNIKQSFKTTNNKALKERLLSENKNIFKRVNEIYKIADSLNKNNNEKINFSKLLFEIRKVNIFRFVFIQELSYFINLINSFKKIFVFRK